MKRPFSLFLVIFAALCLPSGAFAQEGAAPAVTAPVPAAPAAPAAPEAPKVTARKEDETEESAPVAGSSDHATRMNFLQSAVAKFAGVTTDPKLVTENQRLASELSASQSTVTALQAEIATLREEFATLSTQYSEQSAFVDQLAAAPAQLANPTAEVLGNLTPAQAAVAEGISAGVAAQVRNVGQPAAKLPGAGAEKTEKPALSPSATRNTNLSAYWAERGLQN